MSPVAISAIVFVSVFGGALAGIALRAILPEHHLSSESKDVVKLSMGLVATMSALVLGLLVASAKSSYDTQGTRDHRPRRAGRAARPDAGALRSGDEAGPRADQGGGDRDGRPSRPAHEWHPARRLSAPTTRGELPYDLLQALTPKDEDQRALKEETPQDSCSTSGRSAG